MMFDHKGIAYEPYERCYSLDRKEDLREVNLRAEVPTIVLDDGRIISDSTIIADEFERPDAAFIGAPAGWNGRFDMASSMR